MRFTNQINLEFNFSFEPKKFTREEVTENKIFKKIKKHNYKRKDKIENDICEIKALVSTLQEDEEMMIISKMFDCPNIINSYTDEIEELYISTWAITPAGIDSLIKLMYGKNFKDCVLLLDKTHSYKWIFTSGAYKVIKGHIKIKFTANHSKFIAMKTTSGKYTFVGSMNMSNNPRWENITINRSSDDFDFFKNFITNVPGQVL